MENLKVPNVSFSRVLTTQLPGNDTYHAIYTVIHLMTRCTGKTTFHCWEWTTHLTSSIKVKKDGIWKTITYKITKIGDSVWLNLFICNTVVCEAAYASLRWLERYSIFKINKMGSMIPKEIKYNLHYDDVRGHFLRPPHGTITATVLHCQDFIVKSGRFVQDFLAYNVKLLWYMSTSYLSI